MPGNVKVWRAFLSVTKGPTGEAVNAIDRIGEGPWYDRVGRVVAMNKEDLIQTRPRGADPAIINDLPNEDGIPNHNPDGTGKVDNHDMLTGTNPRGTLFSTDWGATCHDWTSSVGADGRPHCGHTWPTGAGGGGGGPDGGGPGGGGPGTMPDGGIVIIGPDGAVIFPDGGFRIDGGIRPPGLDGGAIGDLSNWMSALDEAGCAPGVNLIETGPPNPANPTVGFRRWIRRVLLLRAHAVSCASFSSRAATHQRPAMLAPAEFGPPHGTTLTPVAPGEGLDGAVNTSATPPNTAAPPSARATLNAVAFDCAPSSSSRLPVRFGASTCSTGR